MSRTSEGASSPRHDPKHERTRAIFGLFVALGLVFAVRALGFEYVFVDDTVVFPPADAQYHMRRALFSFLDFPSVLLFDPYINYPGGASIPWPPLFAVGVAWLARLLAHDVHGFEVVAAWVPPLLAVSCGLAIHGMGRRVANRGVGLLACLIFAGLPISLNYTRIGNVDHHAAVAAIGAGLLYTCMRLADPAVAGRRLFGLAVALSLGRLAMLLTWHGSLLYLALTEATLLASVLFNGNVALLRAQALGAAAVALCVAGVVAGSPTPLLGPYSSIALSWLHVSALSGVAFVAGALWLWQRWRPVGGVAALSLRTASLALGFFALLLAAPGPRRGLVPAMQFLTLRDDVGSVTLEQAPLFALFGRRPIEHPEQAWGFFAWLIPFVPLIALLAARTRSRSPSERAAAYVLAGWGAFFAAMTLLQQRYGNDFAPAASVAFAVGLCAIAGAFARRSKVPARWRPVVTGVLGVVLVVGMSWPAIRDVHLPRARESVSAWRDPEGQRMRTASTVSATLMRFGRAVRAATPETSGYLLPGEAPEYGVIANPNIGHALQYVARRATATDPFWAYIGRENWERSMAFLAARREDEALAQARSLRGRYVVTMPALEPGTVAHYLHRHDGVATPERNRLQHFRLVTESTGPGLSIGSLAGSPARAGDIAYKLFEVVEGALLEVRAPPGSDVVASVEVGTPRGRHFVYRALARADEAGLARLRLPYATAESTPVKVADAYRLRVDDRNYRFAVSERAVWTGAKLALDATP